MAEQSLYEQFQEELSTGALFQAQELLGADPDAPTYDPDTGERLFAEEPLPEDPVPEVLKGTAQTAEQLELSQDLDLHKEDPLQYEAALGFTSENIPEEVEYYASVCSATLPAEEVTSCYQGLLKNAFGKDVRVHMSPKSNRAYFTHPETDLPTYIQTPGLTWKDVEYEAKHGAWVAGGELTVPLVEMLKNYHYVAGGSKQRSKMDYDEQLLERIRRSDPSYELNQGVFSRVTGGLKRLVLRSAQVLGAEGGLYLGSLAANISELSDLRERGALPERFGEAREYEDWGDFLSEPGNRTLLAQAGKNAGIELGASVAFEGLFHWAKNALGIRSSGLGGKEKNEILQAIESWKGKGVSAEMQELGAKEHMGHILLNQSREELEAADKALLQAEQSLRRPDLSDFQARNAQAEMQRAKAAQRKAQLNEAQAQLITGWIDQLSVSEQKALIRGVSESSVPHAAYLLLQKRAQQLGIPEEKLTLEAGVGEATWLQEISEGLREQVDNAYQVSMGKQDTKLVQGWRDADKWAEAAVAGAVDPSASARQVQSSIDFGRSQIGWAIEQQFNAVRRFIDPGFADMSMTSAYKTALDFKETIISKYAKGTPEARMDPQDQGTIRQLDKVLDVVAVEGSDYISFNRLSAIISGIKRERSFAFADEQIADTKILNPFIESLEEVRLENLYMRASDEGADPLFRQTLGAIDQMKVESQRFYNSSILGEFTRLQRTPDAAMSLFTRSSDKSDKAALEEVYSNALQFLSNAGEADKAALGRILKTDLSALDPESLNAVSSVKNAIRHQWAKETIPDVSNRSFKQEVWRTGRIADEGYASFVSPDAHARFMEKNKEIIDLWFTPEEAAKFNDAAAMGRSMLETERLWSQAEKQMSKKFRLKDISEPEKLFSKVWVPQTKGGLSRAEGLLDILAPKVDGVRTPVSDEAEELLQHFRTRIGQDLLRETARKDKLGNVEYVSPDKFRKYWNDHADMFGVWFDTTLTKPDGTTVHGADIFKELGEAVNMAMPTLSSKGIDATDDATAKAVMDLTRAYVGIFTTPGRMVTAAKRLYHRASEQTLFWDIMDPNKLQEMLIREGQWNHPAVHHAVRILGALAGHTMYVSEEDAELDLPPVPSNLLKFREELRRRDRQSPEDLRSRPSRGRPIAPTQPTSQLTPEMFAPQPQPQTPPPQVAYLPPSMRNPQGILGQMAQQRPPMSMAEGGFVNPLDLWSIYREAKDLGSHLPGHLREGPGDALRHAYASARATQEYGPERAKRWGEWYEDYGPGSFGYPWENDQEASVRKLNREADLRANAVGRQVGQTATTREEALKGILGLMHKSTGQDSFWQEQDPSQNRQDTTVPLSWNRQHYAEDPQQTRTGIEQLQQDIPGVIKKITVGKARKP